MQTKTQAPASWRDILHHAVTEPGTLSAAYSAFHAYSLGNQMLAHFQCIMRDIPIGPIATYNAWKDKGRQVRRGEKALVLCQPVTVKRDRGESEDPDVFTTFTYRPRWFALAQTDGADLEPTAFNRPEWSAEKALAALGITREAFAHVDGNCQGYARGRSIAVSPLAAFPLKTTVHELAHVVLGHTAQGECSDSETLPRHLREVEAESVAYVLCTLLDAPGKDSARAYIQHWLAGADVPEKSAQRILGAAQTILEAGK